MWLQILCGFIFYKLLRYFFSDNDDVLGAETSDYDALLSVANRVVKLYGGEVYVGLRVPDADTGSRQNIDMVAVTNREAILISVKNFSGFVSINADGRWVRIGQNDQEEILPDLVIETKRQVAVLQSYLEQRGVFLPEEYLSCKVILSNPKSCILNSSSLSSEVITYDQWTELKPQSRNLLSNLVRGAFGGAQELQEQIRQKLNFVLSTTPMWDRLELRGDKYILGEFLKFKGKQEDIQALGDIKRSKVSKMVIQKFSMFGLAHSKVQVLYSHRDYRSEGASASEWKETTVKSSTEVLFQPKDSNKSRKFKLSKVVSLSLSA